MHEIRIQIRRRWEVKGDEFSRGKKTILNLEDTEVTVHNRGVGQERAVVLRSNIGSSLKYARLNYEP